MSKVSREETIEPTGPVDRGEYLSTRPDPLRVPEATAEIRRRLYESGRRLVVLDDDPTGTQTMHDVPVLTTWSYSELRRALEAPAEPVFYILTNSRSLPASEAVALNREICARLSRAAADAGVDFAVTSRSDSTLRGHYPSETDAIGEALEGRRGRSFDGVIVCPAFFEAGRITVDDVHWVEQDGVLVPVGETEFASDPDFGYSASNLASWIEEKTEGRLPAGGVLSIGLADLREGGPERVSGLLREVRGGQPVIVNATGYADLEVFVLGLLDAEEAGKSFVYRTGPSFVRARSGASEKDPLGADDLYRRRSPSGRGLVIVGSHVRLTNEQLECAGRLDELEKVEVSVPRLLEPEWREEELESVSRQVNRGLARSDVMVYTSRGVAGCGGRTQLEVGEIVSGALVEVMRRVDRKLSLRFVVAKGGITSSEIATRGLNVRRAEVAGQMLPGIIPAWILPEDSDYPGLPYVVFPGNVGGPDSLAQVIETLRGSPQSGAAEGSEEPGSRGAGGLAETRFSRVLRQAQRAGRAVGAFTCYNLEGLEAVIRAAESRRAPVVVLVSPSSFEGPGGERLVRAFQAAAAGAAVDVLIQLDHVSDLGSIERAASCGFDAVMADGSRLSFEENLDFTRGAVRLLHPHGIGVEGELGRVEGGEDETLRTLRGEMTSPREAAEFAEGSGIGCLAASIGNVHGHYEGTPSLDWERLEEVGEHTQGPLSLHGASGLPEADLRRAVRLGACKINVNTELRAAYFGVLEAEGREAARTLNLKRLSQSLTGAVEDKVLEKLSVFGWTEDRGTES